MKIIDNAFYFIIFLRNLTILITSQSIIIVGITYWDATAKKKRIRIKFFTNDRIEERRF